MVFNLMNNMESRKMSTKILEITATLREKNGEVMFSTSDTKEVPDFTEVGKSEFLPSLDDLETALIEAAKKVKTAAAEHAINEGSKKKVDEAAARLGSEGLIITASDYGIETKFGPIVGIQYRIVNGRMTIYRSSDDCFPELGSRERLHSSKYDKLFLWNSTKMSFRDTALNLTMWRDQDIGAIIPMTLRNQADRHGDKITAAISQTAEQALSKAGFNNDVKQLTQEERSDWLK
jgi:hypothetical protein